MASNRIKLDIAMPMDGELDTKDLAILKGNGIKLPVFKYRGEIETSRNDITQKKVEDKFKRASRMLFATAAMHVTDAIKDNKLATKPKDKAPVAAATKSIDAGCDKVARKMTKLMDEIVKAYGSDGKSEEPGFDKLAQIERYVTGLAELSELADASKAFKEGVVAICKGPSGAVVDELARAYTAYGRKAAKGIAIVEATGRIPKVDATGADGKAITHSKIAADTDKEVAKQIKEMKETADLLSSLPKPMHDLHGRVLAISDAYEALQAKARRVGVTVTDGGRFPMIGTHDIAPMLDARAEALALIKELKRSLKR